MNLSEIIKRRRHELNLTLKEIADEMGVSEATVQRYESGNIKNLRHNRITDLARALKMPPAELMGWEDKEEKNDIFSIPGILPIETYKIPLLGSVSCGELKYADEDFEGYVQVGSNIHADYAIRAKGDSMIGAFIRDGDLVFVKQQPVVENGDIAVVSIDGDITLKRFKQVNDTVFLIPENSEYDIITVDLKNNDSVRILGKAVAFQSDAR